MKKLFLIIVLILVGIVSLSFLLDINRSKNNSLFIYVDKNIVHKEILKKNVYDTLLSTKKYNNIIFSSFNTSNIDSYIVSNGKNSLFITSAPLKSKLFSLKSIKYEKTLVAISSIKSPINDINYSSFIDIYKFSKNNNINENLKNIINNKSEIAVIPYYKLTIKLKPLKINGIFPSVYNVKKGLYPGTLNVYISTINYKIYRQCKKINAKNKNRAIFSIIAGGDIMLGRAVKKYIDKHSIYYPFKKIKYLINSNDIAFANLESPLTNSKIKFSPNKGIYFKADPIMALALKWCGFDVLSLANNHIFDWGITGALDTERYLRNIGIKYSGIGKSLEDAVKPAVFDMRGTKVCFVSMDDIFPTKVKNGKNILRTYTYNRNIKRDLAHLRKRYDVLIVSYHTGIEYKKHPELEKIKRMKSLIDYGADIVFGAHPHVFQDIEIYKNGLIAYSLGNLIFDQNWSEDTSKGLLLEVGFFGKRLIYFRPIYVDIIKGQAIISNNQTKENLKIVLNF